MAKPKHARATFEETELPEHLTKGRPFSELQEQMSPEAREKSQAKYEQDKTAYEQQAHPGPLELALMARGESTIRDLEDIVDHVLGGGKALAVEVRKTKTPCCDYEWDVMKDSGPIFWNPYNSVVQCHNCGSSFVSIPQAENAGAQFNQRLDSEFEKRLREKTTWDGLQAGLSGAGDGSLATLGGDSKGAALGQQRAPVETNELSRYEAGFRRVGYGPAHDLPGGDVLAYVTIPEMYAESLLGEAGTQGKSATVFLDETFQNALEGYFSTLRT